MKRKKLLAALTAFTMAAATAVNGLYISAAAAGIPAAEDSQDLILDCGGRAGYDYLGTLENGEAMQALYDDLYETACELWNDTDKRLGTIQDYGVIGTVNMNGLEFEEASKVYFTFKSDNPIFYFCSVVAASSGDYFVMLCDSDYCDPELRETAQQSIEGYIYDMAAAAQDGEKELDKVKAVHDKLCDDLEYARDASGAPSKEYWAHNVTGAPMYGKGVCESYARSFQLIMNYIDIDNRLITGISNNDNHSWNMVRMEDGLNYFVDCTWDDLHGSYEYFMRGSERMDMDHRTDGPDGDPAHFLPTLEDVSPYDYDPDEEQDDRGDHDKDTTDSETTGGEDGEVPAKGDANGDGDINVTDIAVIAGHIKGIKPLGDNGMKAADADESGELNVTDIAMIASHIKGIRALS